VVLASCRAGLGQGCLAGPLYRPLGGRWPAGRGPVLVLGGAVLASGLLEPIAGSVGGLLQAGPEVGREGADELADLGPLGQPAGGLGNPLVAFAASPGPPGGTRRPGRPAALGCLPCVSSCFSAFSVAASGSVPPPTQRPGGHGKYATTGRNPVKWACPNVKTTSVSAGQRPVWWACQDLNLGPHPYQ
jgi:hypothetical protein